MKFERMYRDPFAEPVDPHSVLHANDFGVYDNAGNCILWNTLKKTTDKQTTEIKNPICRRQHDYRLDREC